MTTPLPARTGIAPLSTYEGLLLRLRHLDADTLSDARLSIEPVYMDLRVVPVMENS